MYAFMARKYGEENIAAFVVHLDESLPHIHCTIVPITQSGKLSYREIFAGENKYVLAQRTKQLHDELAEVNKKWGLERGDSVAVTGAQHKTYLQWLKEQILGGKKTIEEQGETITRQSGEISEQKQQLYAINAEIKKAEKKLKGLTTMIENLEDQKDNIEAQIAALEEEYQNGNDEAIKKMQQLNAQLAEINAKIDDKNSKLAEAQNQLRELATRKQKLQNEYTMLMQEKNKELPDVLDKTQMKANDAFWQLAAEDMKKEYSAFEKFADKLPLPLRTEFSNLMEGSFFEDLAQRGEQMAAVSAALFLGYIDAATQIAQSGGGGGSPGIGWGRDKDEDDDSYMRRCCIMGRMMMKPAVRRLKRS